MNCPRLYLATATVLSMLILCAPAMASSPPQPASAPPPSRPLPMVSFAPLVDKVLPAVVSILVVGEALDPAEFSPGQPVPAPQKRPFRSGGSGVIVSAALGLIGTNRHVVKDATSITVRLHDGREAPAKLLGIDAGADIAMIKIDLPDLTEIPFGNSSNLRVGDFVIAVGNPFGLEGSATAGIVSGLMRSDIGYDIYESFIQIDAAVNPGNSGGALVNLDGELIGINTAVGRQGAGSVGIAFAVPINMARRIGTQIYLHGRMRRGSVGLETRDISQSTAAAIKLADRRGALVTAVEPTSPAARSGIKPGCVIKSVNGDAVNNNSVYMAYFGSSAVGEQIEMELACNGTREKLQLTVSDEVSNPHTAEVAVTSHALGGLTLGEIGPRSPLYGQLQGVIVRGIAPDSPAARTGLMTGDVILAINQLTISAASNVSELARVNVPIERVSISRDGVPYIVVLRR